MDHSDRTMTIEDIVRRWRPEAQSQLQQWINTLAGLGARSDQLLAARNQLLIAQHDAAGRQMLARFKAEPVAIAQADAHFAQLETALNGLDTELVTLRAQESTLELQVYQADEYLQGIMIRLEQGLAATNNADHVSDRIDAEFVAHERRVQQLLRGDLATSVA